MKAGNACAVMRQHPRPRRRLAHEPCRPWRGRSPRPPVAATTGKVVGQRVDQRADDVVAVHRQARGRVGAIPGAQARGTGTVAGPAARPRSRLAAATHAVASRPAVMRHPSTRRSAAAGARLPSRRRRGRLRPAGSASAGTSLSRSSSVGTGAESRSTTWAYRPHTASSTGLPWLSISSGAPAASSSRAKPARWISPTARKRQFAQAGQRVPAVVGAGHMQVVDVQQQAAAGAPQHLAQELRPRSSSRPRTRRRSTGSPAACGAAGAPARGRRGRHTRSSVARS